MNLTQEVKRPSAPSRERRLADNTVVCLSDAVKYFRTPGTEVRALRGVKASIAVGETVALLGPNGAGKSTTIDLLLGLNVPDGGSVSVLGLSPEEAVAGGLVGAMLQGGALMRDVSPRELLALMASLYPRPLPVAEALDVAGLTEIADRRTQKLSGGQSQRVRFALALVSDPAVLILDEPTVGMDVEARREFWTSVRAFAARGRTVIFATHYLEEADAYADRIVLMAHGRVVADGPPSEIKARVQKRTITATLPDAEPRALSSLPGVSAAQRRGASIVLVCSDADVAIRAFLAAYPDARDIQVNGAGLEEAFLELTGDQYVAPESRRDHLDTQDRP